MPAEAVDVTLPDQAGPPADGPGAPLPTCGITDETTDLAPAAPPPAGPFAAGADAYWPAGWPPIPVIGKFPPEPGYTGWKGAYASYPDIQAWKDGKQGSRNIGIRLPDGYLGIDVDNYGSKPGAATLASLEEEYGPLPPTVMSTSRDDGVSGIRIFKIPPGLSWSGEAGPGIEIIVWSHRYVMCWPSVHPEGRIYRWRGPDGAELPGVPPPDEIPNLPPPWLIGLMRGQADPDAKADIDAGSAAGWIGACNVPSVAPCGPLAIERDQCIAAMAAGGSRHEAARDGALALVRLADQGHVGIAVALDQIRTHFLALVSADRHGAASEWQRMLCGAIGIVTESPSQRFRDPCRPPVVGAMDSLPPVIDTAEGTAAQVLSLDPDVTAGAPAPEVTNPPVDAHARAVDQRVAALRVDREARRILARENAPEVPKPQSLADLLAEPDEEVQYRIDQLLPVGGNALLAAQFKAGKTTLTGNFVRCCVDGGFFLSGFTMLSPSGRVVLIDTEMDKRMIRRWLRDQGIRRTDRVDVVALRGQVAAFNPMDDVNRAEWAERLAGAKDGILVLDCLRPILDAHGLSEKEDAGTFLVALDALKVEVGASEVLLVHHMGHTGERSRGDSRLRDWPDVEWRLVREGKEGEDAEPNAPRYFSAYGRDVDVPEGRLEFDAATRHLTYRNGNRQEEKAKQISASAKLAMADARQLLKKPNVKLSQNSLIAELETLGHGQTAARKGIRHAVDDGLFLIEDGERGAKLHYLNPSRRDDEQA